MSALDANGTSPAKKSYASNSTFDILAILWQETRSGHGLSTSQIHDRLKRSLGTFSPSLRTVRNQLNAMEGSQFLGRTIHKLDPKNEDDAGELDGAADSQPGWRMSTLFDPSEIRLLTDSLALSRIDRDAISDLVEKLNGLVGDIKLSNDYLITTNARDNFNRDFLYSIGQLNDAITRKKSVIFNYMNYNKVGELTPRINSQTNEPRIYHVDPYQMIFKNGRYYLICSLHNESDKQRIFCIDRIINVKISNEIMHNQSQQFDAISYMRKRPYPVTDEVVKVVMHVEPKAFNYIFDWFDSPEIVGPDAENHYKVTVKSPVLAAYWWALQYADQPIVICEPAQLRERLTQAGETLEDRYPKGSVESDGNNCPPTM